MRLASFLLPLVMLVHTSAWQPEQGSQMVEDRPFAAPQPQVLEERIDTREVEQPGSLEERGSILSALTDIVTDLIPGLLSIFTEEERECEFVGRVNATILLDYRDLNVIIFHDTSSDSKGLHDPICFDMDLPLPFPLGSKGYRICAFDTGTFVRHGDGGCRNWGFGACVANWTDDKKTVSFCSRKASPITTTTAEKHTATRGTTTTADTTTTRTKITTSTKPATTPTTVAKTTTTHTKITTSTKPVTTTVTKTTTTPAKATSSDTQQTTISTTPKSPGTTQTAAQGTTISSSTRTGAGPMVTQQVFAAAAAGVLAAYLAAR